MTKKTCASDRRDHVVKRERDQATSIWKGLAAGLAGGLVASWAMNQFQEAWSSVAQDAQGKSASESSGANQRGAEAEEEDDTTMKVASAISQAIFDHKLTKSEKKKAGPAVHYAFGGSMGALYGAMVEIDPKARSGKGTAFSTMLWLAGDEAALPLLGLTKSPTEYPLSVHAYGFASHVVYGLTSDCVRRVVRKALG